jgi:hypothetical protein
VRRGLVALLPVLLALWPPRPLAAGAAAPQQSIIERYLCSEKPPFLD